MKKNGIIPFFFICAFISTLSTWYAAYMQLCDPEDKASRLVMIWCCSMLQWFLAPLRAHRKFQRHRAFDLFPSGTLCQFALFLSQTSLQKLVHDKWFMWSILGARKFSLRCWAMSLMRWFCSSCERSYLVNLPRFKMFQSWCRIALLW